MVEFRTEAPGQTTGESGGSLGQYLETAIENIKNDPEMQKQLVSQMRENDVNPMLLRAFVPQAAEIEDMDNEPQPNAEIEREPEPRVETQEITPEQLEGFLQEIIDLRGEDTTLGELQEFVQNNPDMVQTAIDMVF